MEKEECLENEIFIVCKKKTFLFVAHFFAPLFEPISTCLFNVPTWKSERKPLESNSFSSRISLFCNKEFSFSLPQTNSLETQKKSETMSSGFNSSHIFESWEEKVEKGSWYCHKFIMYWQLFPSSLQHSLDRRSLKCSFILFANDFFFLCIHIDRYQEMILTSKFIEQISIRIESAAGMSIEKGRLGRFENLMYAKTSDSPLWHLFNEHHSSRWSLNLKAWKSFIFGNFVQLYDLETLHRVRWCLTSTFFFHH